MRPYGGRGILSGVSTPRTTNFIIYYLLSIIYKAIHGWKSYEKRTNGPAVQRGYTLYPEIPR
jgi:hypothetical protein